MIQRVLFERKDNATLIVFRILFGLLVIGECVGALLTGWVKEVFVDTQFTFTFFGFEWASFLHGEIMYFYYVVMAICGVGIALGYRYRIASWGFFIMWSLIYFLQKSHYNNHYYLLMLIAFFMAVLPAHLNHSMDAKAGRVKRSDYCDNWQLLIFKWQMAIVYFFASIVKLYPDWLALRPIKIWFDHKDDYWLIGDLLQNDVFQHAIAYGAIFFDLLVVPLFFFRKTRTIALICSFGFHLFNSIVFQIGVFPFFALSFIIFFYPTATIRRLFLRTEVSSQGIEVRKPAKTKWIITGLVSVYFFIQLLLPVRNHFIQDDVLWTEEGHRHSWRMMLRTKSGLLSFMVKKQDGTTEYIRVQDHVAKYQKRAMSFRPDMIWQFAQYLKTQYEEPIEVYVKSSVSVNGSFYYTFIDPDVDLANANWNHFGHNEWIMPKPQKMEYR